MFTRNWYNAIAAMTTGESISNGFRGYTGSLRNCHYGQTYTITNLRNSLITPTVDTAHQNFGVRFGSGSTPATIDDIALESVITSGLTISASVGTQVVDDNGITMPWIYTITNSSAKDITIAEIGLWGYINHGTSAMENALLERTVLDEPVTIPAGGIGMVTYSIRYKYPT